MHGLLIKLTAWLSQKLLAAAVIVVLAVGLYGAWLYLQEEHGSEQQRIEQLQRLTAERERLLAAQTELAQRLGAAQAEASRQAERARQAERIISRLRELESWWDRVFGNPEQQSANAAQLQRMEGLKNEATSKAAELQRALTKLVSDHESAGDALRRVNSEIATLQVSQSRARHYVHAAWDRTKWIIALALAGYFLGPTVWKVGTYYAVAPMVSYGRPIRLSGDPAALPEVGESRVSIDATLRPGEVLRIKEQFLQASDESAGRRTCFVLDWRIPFTSLAAGLTELVELRPSGSAGESRVTLSSADDPHIELALVDVPPGASLILRPSFLAGVIQRDGDQLQIRRHWRILHWQAWVSGQFRFFEFVGPCRLVVTGSRGVRAERLAGSGDQPSPARRTNQDATIGFTPNLDYRPVRAETFWSYYRGMNPLFDDLFAGRGLFVLQETASAGPGGKAARFWSGIWNAVLKVFGL